MQYGVSYFGNRIRRYVKQDMQYLAEQGFTYVLHTYSENDWSYYETTMKEIVEDAHSLGLKVHLDPWGMGGIFGGEAFSQLVSTHPEMNQVLNSGEMAPAVCLNNPLFREHMKAWIDSAAKLQADYILWDEPHWYIARWFGRPDQKNLWTCRCPHCQTLFFRQFGYEMPTEMNQDINQFRADSVLSFLEDMTTYAHQVGIRNAVCLLPDEFNADLVMDWEKVVSLPNVDMFGTDPYWYLTKYSVEEFVSRYAERIRSLCLKYRKEEQLWIQAFRVPENRESEIDIAFTIMREHGINNISVWGFEACKHMSSLRPANPELVWKRILDNIR
ncbi:MAG TPA: hypothetical protein PLE74_01795 [Candidatus Cloacimonadota bacterium]|nr:hypothetical protein [Candidatus Cloacimonadota bacterium]HPT70998.1 hypothetical protein [Candidatus Cloacimonadota bacterium]